MRKSITLIALALCFQWGAEAQVGIGTNSPEASSALDISSTDKGFLMPRMTTAQRNAIASPAQGLSVYDTDTQSFWTYIDSSWLEDKPGTGKFVEGASTDIAYYQDRVGIGIDDFGVPHKLFVSGEKEDAGTNTAVRINADYTGTGTSTATYGLASFARNMGSATVDYAIGTQGIVHNQSGGSINVAVGSWPQVINTSTISFTSGLISEVRNNGGTIATGRAMDIGVNNATGSSIGLASLGSMYFTNNGSITGDAYGLFIGGEGTGTVGGDSYALYVSTPYNNVAGNAFAIYSVNQANSYIEGNIGVGTSDPQQKVHVNGVMRLEPQSTPPAGALGDMYVGTDNKLYFHDGAQWREVQLAP